MYDSGADRESGEIVGDAAPTRPTGEPHGAGASLAALFGQWFEIVDADTPERVRAAYGIRYQVYCVEQGFEDAAEHPDGMESDEYDSHSVHSLLVHRHTEEPVGTVRLILPVASRLGDSFALQRACGDARLRDPGFLPLQSTGEVSRFGLSKNVRRRKDDTFYGPVNPVERKSEPAEQRATPPLRLGLMRAIVKMSVDHRLTHWCAMMEPALLRILAATGIHFEPLGPLVEHHGLRQPCFGNIRAVLSRLRREKPEVWDFITDEGRYVDRLPDGAAAPPSDCVAS